MSVPGLTCAFEGVARGPRFGTCDALAGNVGKAAAFTPDREEPRKSQFIWKLAGLLYFLSGAFAAERPVRVHLSVAAIVYARLLRAADALGGCVWRSFGRPSRGEVLISDRRA